MQNWDFSGTWGLLQMLLPILYLHNMRYWTDPMSQSLENGQKLRFWANFDIIMLIMRERDFSRTCVFLQMLINTYLLNMRYRTDPMTQFWAKCEKPQIWANFDIIMLIMRKRDFFSKIRPCHFFLLYALICCRKSEKTNGWEVWELLWLTDRRKLF